MYNDPNLFGEIFTIHLQNHIRNATYHSRSYSDIVAQFKYSHRL
jgi:hypothetical protein